MFIKYTFNAGWTWDGLIQDLKGLLTGEIDISGCSSSCNIGQSTQSGLGSFVLHDYVPASKYVVLSATDGDQLTTKYLKISPHYWGEHIEFACSEEWNNSTHVATNASFVVVSGVPKDGIVGTMLIATHGTDWLLIGNSFASAMWGEVLRETPLLATSLAGVPPQSQFVGSLFTKNYPGTTNFAGYQPRTRNFGTLSTYNTAQHAAINIQSICGYPTTDVYDGNNQSFVQANPAIAVSNGSFLGRIRGGVKTGHSVYTGTTTWGDTIYVDGVEHLIVGSYLFPLVA